MPALNDILSERLENTERQGLRRELVTQALEEGPYLSRAGRRYLNFSGNDYLGLRTHPEVVRAAGAALDAAGAGSGAARLVTGNHAYYHALEQALAENKKAEAALVFGSGYLANSGSIAALVGEGDLVLADKLVHACMLDGARLSGATLRRFTHNDVTHLSGLLARYRGEYRHCLILTESVFSMDGDRAPLAAIVDAAHAHDAWVMADDAHGIGLAHEPAAIDIWTGTLSKALGSYGGYIAGSRVLVEYLTNHARSFIFSTALPPASLAAASAALSILQREPERMHAALTHARRLSHALGLPEAQSPIVPYILGDAAAAVTASHALAEAGCWVSAIRPPTVPVGSARLRITCTAAHTSGHIDTLIDAIRSLPPCQA